MPFLIISLLFILSPNVHSRTVLKFNKSNNKLTIIKDQKIIKNMYFSYGKNKGKKTKIGDKKTPEGIYFIKNKLNKKYIKKKYTNFKEYGVGALTLNYPNHKDRKNGYTGGGIWIHGTDFPKRLEKKNVTRGCLILHNKDMIYLLKTIKTNTQVIISP